MKPPLYSPKEVLEGKIFAVLAYISILCIIPLIFKKDNAFVLAHAKQGLVLFIGEVAVFVASIIINEWIIKLCLFLAGIFSLWGMIESLRGRDIRLPIVWNVSEKITL